MNFSIVYIPESDSFEARDMFGHAIKIMPAVDELIEWLKVGYPGCRVEVKLGGY